MNNKITLKEFFDRSNGKLCIRCKTEKQANKLLCEFDKLDKTWGSHVSYLHHNNWNEYKENTVYYNAGTYSDLKYAKKSNYKIYEFEDVILED